MYDDPKLTQNQMRNWSEVFLAVLTLNALWDLTADLVLNTQHTHVAPCMPSHHETPTRAALDTLAQIQGYIVQYKLE